MNYDPTKSYDNCGPRGLSSLEVTEMNIDRHASIPDDALRVVITIAPLLGEVKEIVRMFPEAFDSVQPLPFDLKETEAETMTRRHQQNELDMAKEGVYAALDRGYNHEDSRTICNALLKRNQRVLELQAQLDKVAVQSIAKAEVGSDTKTEAPFDDAFTQYLKAGDV